MGGRSEDGVGGRSGGVVWEGGVINKDSLYVQAACILSREVWCFCIE